MTISATSWQPLSGLRARPFVDAFREMAKVLRNRRMERRARLIIRDLDDHLLPDIGIDPASVSWSREVAKTRITRLAAGW